MSFAPNMLLLIPARLTVGFASGLASVVTPVYLGEIAPPNLRGTLGTMTQFSMVIGILASGLVGIPLATPSGWRYLFGITPLLCFLQIAVSPYLLESPRWLLSKDTQSHEARVVIKKFRGLRSDGDVETEAQHFLFALAKYKTTEASGGIGDTCSAIWELLRERRLRSLVLSALGLQVAQQLCGINAVFYYSTSFFQGVIDDPLVGTNLVAFVNVVATYIALRLMDSTGRRTLLLWSSGGMLVSTALILAALTGYVQQIYALAAVMAFVSFFEIGLGPVPWLIVAEMFDAKYVATAMSLACVVNWACNFLVGLLFPFMQEWLGPWSFGPFAAVIAITYALTLAYLPETRGLSTDEILGEVTSRQKKYGSRIVHVV